MNEEEARKFAEDKCQGKTDANFSIKTDWGWVFRLVDGRRLNLKYPIVFVDYGREKVTQLKDLDIEKKIEIWTKDREALLNDAK